MRHLTLRSPFARWFLLLGLLAGLILPAARPGTALAVAGNFVVNSLADNNVADGGLTLREALLLARRGSAPVFGLGRGLTAAEQAQTFGCVFDAGGLVIDGCGEHKLDFVTFDATLGAHPWLTLASALPPIDDDEPTILNGGSAEPTLDADNLASSESGLQVFSGSNLVEHIGVVNSHGANIEVAAVANTLHDVWAWNGRWGIIVQGSNVEIEHAWIGVDETGVCGGLGNDEAGILLLGSQSAQISDSDIGCNSGSGLHMFGDGTGNTVLSNVAIHDNGDDGIWVDANSPGHHWTHLSVYDNGGLGIDTGTFDANADNPTTPYPIIASASLSAGQVTVSGIASVPGLGTTQVEVYQLAFDPSGFGEGKTYVASANVDMQGHWSVTVPGSSAGCYTAFQTRTNTLSGMITSSEFGPSSCRLFAPLVVQ